MLIRLGYPSGQPGRPSSAAFLGPCMTIMRGSGRTRIAVILPVTDARPSPPLACEQEVRAAAALDRLTLMSGGEVPALGPEWLGQDHLSCGCLQGYLPAIRRQADRVWLGRCKRAARGATADRLCANQRRSTGRCALANSLVPGAAARLARARKLAMPLRAWSIPPHRRIRQAHPGAIPRLSPAYRTRPGSDSRSGYPHPRRADQWS